MMTNKPRIGMIPSLKHNDPCRPQPSRGCIAAIDRLGGEVIVIDYRMAMRDQHALIKSMDGMIFQGGGDMQAHYFNEPMHPEAALVNPLRDDLELRAFEITFERGVPILGICRGAQVMNIAMGGNIYQDLPSQCGITLHRLGENASDKHIVNVKKGSQLHQIAGLTHFPTNSLHHQAIKAPGRGLIASAKTDDGCIEAIELPGYGYLLGLQWHPEITRDDDEVSMRFFKSFIDHT